MSNKKKVIRAEDINEDTDIHELAMFCKEYTDCLKNPKTEAERLRNEIMGDEKTDEGDPSGEKWFCLTQ